MNTLSRTPHLKLQEMCDCYLETDFSRQLKVMVSSKSTDLMEDGFKYLALVLLEAITEKASALVLTKENDSVKVTLKGADPQIELPSPAPEIMSAITTIMRDILHLEEDKGKCPLTLGLKNSQLDLLVRMKKDNGEESLTIEFPELEKKTSVARKPVMPATGKAEEGLTHWKCGKCSFTFTAPSLPEKCPVCDEKCDFLNITCYTPDCGGPGNIDPRLR
jgi:rubredoxin